MFYAITTVLVRANFPAHSASGSYSQSQTYSQNYHSYFNLKYSSSKSIFWSLTASSADPPSVTLISDCVQYLLCSKSLSHFKFCWWYFLFFCFLPAVTMRETSLHHCVSDIDTLWNKGELHLFSHQRFNYCCTEKIYSHCYTPCVVSDPIQFLQKNEWDLEE